MLINLPIHQKCGGTRHFEIAFLVTKGMEANITSDFNLSQRKSLKLEKFNLSKAEKINGIKIHWLKTMPYKINNWKRY